MKKVLLPYRCLIHPEQIITGTCPICKEEELDNKLNTILNNKSNFKIRSNVNIPNPVVCNKHPEVILNVIWDDEEGTFEFTDCPLCDKKQLDTNKWSITGLINRIFGANS